MALLVLLLLVPAGCGASSETEPDRAAIERSELLEAFAAAGEPLVVSLDMSEADPESPLEASFVPEAEDVPEPPYGLDLFESVEAAEAHSESLASIYHEGIDFIRWKNVILSLAPSLPTERRTRLIETLESL
jgi:hypothetical protein